MLTPAEIAQKIAGTAPQLYELPAGDLEDIPPRHRSLRAMVDSVWAIPPLREGLQIAVDIEHYAVLCHGNAAAALLALVQGDAERALQRYAVVARAPFVANAQWFADVYGRRIEPAASATAADADVEPYQRQAELIEAGSKVLFELTRL